MGREPEGDGYFLDEDWRPETREPDSFTEKERAEIIQRLLRNGDITETDVAAKDKYLMYLKLNSDE